MSEPEVTSLEVASDRLFYEVEAPDGFLATLERDRAFDTEGWQRLWRAVASLIHHTNGDLDAWATYDLSRIVAAVQKRGQELIGRRFDSLDPFETAILDANIFINDVLSTS